MFSTVLLHKIKPKICVLAKRIIGLLRECKIGIADSVAFCLSNAFHNKYPFVLFCFGINYRRIYRWCSYLMPQGVAYHNKSPKKVFSLKTTRNPKLSPIGKNFGFFSFVLIPRKDKHPKRFSFSIVSCDVFSQHYICKRNNSLMFNKGNVLRNKA